MELLHLLPQVGEGHELCIDGATGVIELQEVALDFVVFLQSQENAKDMGHCDRDHTKRVITPRDTDITPQG